MTTYSICYVIYPLLLYKIINHLKTIFQKKIFRIYSLTSQIIPKLNQKKNTFPKSEFYQFFRNQCPILARFIGCSINAFRIAGRSNTSVTQSRSISTEHAFIPCDMQFANEQGIHVIPPRSVPCRNSNLVECRVQGSSRASSLVRDDWFSLCRPS